MAEIKDRIILLRKEKGLNQSELAKKLNISPSTIGMIEQGRRNPSYDLLESICDFFNVDMDYLMGRSNIPNKHKAGMKYDWEKSNIIPLNQELISIPIYESISAGYGSVIDDSYIEPTDIDYLPMPNFPNWQNCFAIKVSGDSMEPTIPNGAIVLINTELSIDNNKIGAFAIGDDSFLKRKKILNNSILLISDNKEYEPILVNENDNFKEIGKVIKVIIDFSSL